MRRATALLPVLAVACGVSEPPTTRSNLQRLVPQVPEATLKRAVHDDTEFALALHRLIGGSSANVIASPHSITTAVAMLWAGARTTSEASIAQALHFGLPQAELHPVFNALDRALAARNATVDDADVFTLRVVNDLWAQDGFEILPHYLDALAQNYGAGVRRVDFAGDTEGTRQLINDWIADQTEDRIRDLFPKGAMDGSTVLALTNAVYFKADWADAFEESNTRPDTFTLADGTAVQANFMHRTAAARFSKQDHLVAVELPYKGDELALLAVMPDDLVAFEGSLDASGLEAIAGSLRDGEVELALPKFTTEASFSLEDALTELGMGDVFGADADLSGIDGARDLFVQAVVHKAFIEVSEEGTEAAAATGITVGRAAAPVGEPIALNKPFLYCLRDRVTGAVLFVGRLGDPR